eukprot:1001983-Pyramimonas_sp.AAC.1
MLSPVRELDPIFRATNDPVCMMHRAVWDSWLPVSILSDALDLDARRGLGSSSRAHQRRLPDPLA